MRHNKGLLYSFLIIGLFVAIIVANDLRPGPKFVPRSASVSSSTRRIVYKATTSRLHGDCFAFDATYEMPNGTAQKTGGVCNGLTSVVVAERTAKPGDFVYLSVQNDNWSATIGCEIRIDDKLVYHTTSQGQYVIASCSGTVD